jgi:hypothetical protein
MCQHNPTHAIARTKRIISTIDAAYRRRTEERARIADALIARATLDDLPQAMSLAADAAHDAAQYGDQRNTLTAVLVALENGPRLAELLAAADRYAAGLMKESN